MQLKNPRFVRRLNANRTVDSICTRCTATVGRADTAEELAPLEAAHACDPNVLELRNRLTKRGTAGAGEEPPAND